LNNFYDRYLYASLTLCSHLYVIDLVLCVDLARC